MLAYSLLCCSGSSSFCSASILQLWGIVRMLVIIDSYNSDNFAALCWLCSVLCYFDDSSKKFVCLIGTKCIATRNCFFGVYYDFNFVPFT